MNSESWSLDCQCQITLGMIQALGGSNTSMLLAPLTSFVLLTMAYVGAGNRCLPEIYQFETCGQTYSGFHRNFQMFMPKVGEKSKYTEYTELFVQKDVILKPGYLEFFKHIPGVGIRYVDYQDPKTLRLINAEVNNVTNQKIDQIVSKLDSDLKLLAVGASIIVDKWKVPFNNPANGTFYINEKTNKTILMMQQTSSEFGYAESEYFYGLRLAFNSSLSGISHRNCTLDTNRTKRTKDCSSGSTLDTVKFLMFLPKERFGLANALPHLNGKIITELLNTDASKTEVNLTIPSFNFTFSTGLKNVLPKLGLKYGFDPKLADFSRMTDQKVYIDDIIQTTKIEITSNEIAVEAAGATKVLRQTRSSRTPVIFEANQPFLYMIISGGSMIDHAGVFN